MGSISLKAYAKINLSLDVTRRRPDGYHEVRMIMQTVELHDRLVIETANEAIDVTSNCRWVPSGSGNIAFKAAHLLMRKLNIPGGVKIKIDKRIPVAAGMAGGSTDAAAVLKGMNELFSLGLKTCDLEVIGKEIGADVPFCIRGGTMLAEGIGEILTELSPMPRTDLVLIKPKIGVSTQWVYKNLDLNKVTERPDTDSLINAIGNKKLDYLAKNMKNVLETVTVQKHGIIQEIKDKLLEHGAQGSMMSGSGPTVFGVFSDGQTAQNAYTALKDDRWECFLTSTLN